jgi:hypothetical protein
MLFNISGEQRNRLIHQKNKQIKPSIKIKLYGANGTSFFLADRPNVNFLPKRERFRVLYISADATPV